MTMTTRPLRLSLVALLAVPSLLSTGCKHAPPPAEDAPAKLAAQTVTATSQLSTEYLDIPAHFMADPAHVVHIYPPLSGRIFGLKVLPGQEVRKGDEIAMLQSNDVAVARSDFEKTKIEVLRADRALARGKLLIAHDVMSQADYQELEAVDQVAHSELERSRQHIRELGFDENGTSDIIAVRAPIAGAVLDIGTATGELQKSLDNANSIATIANLDTIWLSGDVFERDLASLSAGHSVQVLVPAYPDLRLTGTVANVGDAIDPATHTLKLRVVLANPGHKLKPEMFATIRVSGAVRRAFVVPETAVLHEGEKTSVFVQLPNGKYDQRMVAVGRSSERDGTRMVEILNGISEGDKVVAVGGALLRPSTGE